MKLTSSSFEDGAFIDEHYTCDGENTHPPLSIADVPEQTKSLVLLMDDPDAPNGTWDHWVLFDIDPATEEIPEGTEPPGKHGIGTSGNRKYEGPCPPDREHRYRFRVLALDIDRLPESQAPYTKADVERLCEGHIIAEATLLGRYNRKR